MKAMRGKRPLLRLKNIHKWFESVHALKGVDFKIYAGETVGLIGDNGAGKSTLMKIVSGAIPKDDGNIYWKNTKVKIDSIKDARKLGIEIVYQEQAIIDTFGVAKNIFLGREETKFGLFKVLDREKMLAEAGKVTKELGLRMPPTREVRFCSGGEKQGVAVSRALLFESELVILDEPTRALSAAGVEKVLDFIRNLSKEEIATVFISHTFSQIYPVADRFVILSRGEVIGEKKKEETSPDELSEIIISGRMPD